MIVLACCHQLPPFWLSFCEFSFPRFTFFFFWIFMFGVSFPYFRFYLKIRLSLFLFLSVCLCSFYSCHYPLFWFEFHFSFLIFFYFTLSPHRFLAFALILFLTNSTFPSVFSVMSCVWLLISFFYHLTVFSSTCRRSYPQYISFQFFFCSDW